MPVIEPTVDFAVPKKVTRATTRRAAKISQQDCQQEFQSRTSSRSKRSTSNSSIRTSNTSTTNSSKKTSNISTKTSNSYRSDSDRFDSGSSDSDVSITPKVTRKLLSSPRKTKLDNGKGEVDCPVTPPKQKRKETGENMRSPKTPSSMLKKLTIISPQKNDALPNDVLSKNYVLPKSDVLPKNGVLQKNDILRKDDADKFDVENNENKADKFTPKKLFYTDNTFTSARKALHSSLPAQLPGRERELDDLRTFIKGHLENKTSGTLYVSGPPGTGKTASLSKILQEPDIESEFKEVYVNCTGIKSSGAIYSRIVKELGIKSSGKAEKDNLSSVENYLSKNHKMILLVLDELDQLESKKQSILYTIFEWPAKPNSKIILIGIANALDLTDRILPRLQAHCKLKPKLMHFAPYSKQQIVEIFTDRLKQAGVLEVFAPHALQMLAGKVAAVSGDVRRALDIGRRVIELVEQNKKGEVLRSLDNITNLIDDGTSDNSLDPKMNDQTSTNKSLNTQKVDLKQVVNVLNKVYGTTQSLTGDDAEDSFPLQQKFVICSLLLILKKARNKDVTIGKLHEVYRKVCSKRNLLAVDQAEFAGLCSLIETRGIIRVSGKKEPRLHKVHLEWDEGEVSAALGDKQLMSTILQDDSCLGKL